MFAFDLRWAYATSVPTVWNRVRPQLLHTLPDALGFLILRPQQIAEPEGFPACWTTCLADDHAVHKDGFLVPVVENLFGAPRPNLSEAAIAHLASLGIAPDPDAHAALLGARMLDIGMNDASFWRAVPESVWECRIGGYQVLKKWLSYRDHSILGRPLFPDEVAHVQQTVRRLAAILLLGPELDAAHAACAGA